MTYPWGPDSEPPLPRQPTPSSDIKLAGTSESKLFRLQRPSREEIANITDPYHESLSCRYLVLNRYRLKVPVDPARPSGPMMPHPEGLYGHYEIHGESRPSLFKTWHRAISQAIAGTEEGVRPGAILMFDLRAMPIVTSEDEVRTVAARPQANRIWEDEDEHQFAERMANEWMLYAERTKTL